jgi:hypothetical protein
MRVDLATGTRTFIRQLMPSDRTGVMAIYPGTVRRDGQICVYSYWRQSQDAEIVKGVQFD